MMRALAIAALLLVAACAPVATSTLSRSGTEITVQVATTVPLYDVTLSIINAETGDERCTSLDGDAACVLGSMLANEVTTIRAHSDGDASCVAFGFTRPTDLTSYRSWPCTID